MEPAPASYVARAVEALGGIDGFFNNAGVEGAVAPIPDYPVAEFDRVIAINLRGVFLGLHHVLPVLSDGGAVVNTSSSLGQVGAAAISAYVASKHGVIGLTKSAALEAAARGIRVNAVCPGPIAGRMIDALECDTFGDSGTTFADFVPFGRHGQLDEVADLVAYLLSDEARFITGTAHEVDGAFTTPVIIRTYEPDREINWTVETDVIDPQVNHIFGYRLDETEHGATIATAYYDWSQINPVWTERGVEFPVIPEMCFRASLGILARTVAPGRPTEPGTAPAPAAT